MFELRQKPSKQISDLRSKSGILRQKNTPKHGFGVSAIVTYVDCESQNRLAISAVHREIAVHQQCPPGDFAGDMNRLIDVNVEKLLALCQIDEPVNDRLRNCERRGCDHVVAEPTDDDADRHAV